MYLLMSRLRRRKIGLQHAPVEHEPAKHPLQEPAGRLWLLHRPGVILSALLIAVIAHADPRPSDVLGLLGRSLDPVGIHSSPALRAFAQEFTEEASQLSYHGETSLNRVGGMDATMDALGPIFLQHANTIGAGKINVSLLAQTDLVDYEPTLPGELLIADKEQNVSAVRIDYHLKLRIADVALVLNYGLTDTWEASVLILGVHSNLDINVQGLGKQTHESISHNGFGDLEFRLKHKWGRLGPVDFASGLEFQFPTGAAEQLLGTGDYWITPTFQAHTRGERWDATLNLALDFDVSNSRRSQALYGIGASYAIVPRRLIGVLEFLGRSDLDEKLDVKATDSLYLLPNGTIRRQPLFGLDVGRKDYFDLNFGLRVVLSPNWIAFATAIYEINDVGLHGGNFIPTVGVGGYF